MLRLGIRKGCGVPEAEREKIWMGKSEEEGRVLAPKTGKKSGLGHCEGLRRRMVIGRRWR